MWVKITDCASRPLVPLRIAIMRSWRLARYLRRFSDGLIALMESGNDAAREKTDRRTKNCYGGSGRAAGKHSRDATGVHGVRH
jgi:hypothetical protein